ncbi:protein spire-like [Varroa jacobsoni]|uniref:protein spire-like n=1 Tax=Varroa jacobsoni TaxID=62625 RepID=UPI000BFA0116|nr:protein spire-like [Varroa jacobsoni]
MFSDDELEDSESNASSLTKHPSIEFLSSSSSSSSSSSPQDVTPVAEHQSLPANLKRRASRLSWQKSAVTQLNDPSVAAAARTRKLWRRHSIDVCDAEHQEKLVKNDPFRRSIRVRQEIRIDDSSGTNGSADPKDSGASKIAIVNKQLECLSLTLEEVAHIRSVMTKAELETLLVAPQLYEDVARSKVCFTCRKNRFNVLFSRPVKCHLCERSVCDKCSTKMHIPTHRFDRIPVYMLSPSTPTEEIAVEAPSRDKKASSKKKDEIETAVQTFTSGSAPSSPNINSRASGTIAVHRDDAVDSPSVASSLEKHQQQIEVAIMSGQDVTDDVTENDRKKKSWQDSISKSLLKRPSILRVRAKLRCSPKAANHEETKSELCEKLKAPVLPVCRDCKYLVRSIILSNRNPIVKSHSDNSN